MKKIALLVVTLLLTLTGLGQQINLEDNISVALPKKAEKLTAEQAMNHAAKKFGSDKIIMSSLSRRSPKHLYKIDNVLVTFFTDNHIVKEGHLLEIKNGIDQTFKENPSYSSSLKKINDNSILCVNYILGNVDYYRFFSYNLKNDKAITGIIEFDKADKTDAESVLNQIFSSIHFND